MIFLKKNIPEINRILITDDDPDELFATSRILTKAGYIVSQAASGEEGIEKARQFGPDIMLVDVVMPHVDGYEVCRRIRSEKQFDEVSLILLSSISNTPIHKAKGFDTGADDFISRPFNSTEFLSRIRAMLRIKAMEKHLRLQQEWMQITLSSIGDGLIATDDRERIVYMNPIAEELTSWTREEAAGRFFTKVFNIVGIDTGETADNIVRQVLKTGKPIKANDNVSLIKKNGQTLFISESAAPILNTDKQIIGGVVVFRDITEKKRSEKELTQATINWATLLKSIGQLALVVDPMHRILDANDIALEKTGLTRETIVGKKCFELLHAEKTPPRDCPMTIAIHEKEQRSAETTLSNIEGDFITTCTPILNDAGKIEKLIHISTDISELKQIQQALEQSEQRYRMLFKSSSDPVLVANEKSMAIVDTNEAASRLYGYNHHEFVSMKMADLSSTPSHNQAVRLFHNTNGTSMEYHRKKDGTVFPVEITASSFELNGGKNTIIAIRDISGRIAAEEQKREFESHLRRAQKLESLGTLAGGIAHDFNNILSAILGYTELSIMDVQKGNATTENLNQIYAAGMRAKDLVRQILTFARQSPHHVEPVKIGTIVKEVCNFLRSSLPTTIEICQEILPHAHVMADPTHIHQLLMNLCTNAAHAMEKNGGKLEIVLSQKYLDRKSLKNIHNVRQGEYIKLMVSDTGKGIPSSMFDKIFEPYFTTKTAEEGTGLGLSTAHGIVKGCKGYITVSSEIDKGTCFCIYLPSAKESGFVVASDKGPIPCGDEHILFVDDEPAIVNFGSQLLKSLGYQVTKMVSSSEALALFQADPKRFDLVITDMTMPVISGDKLAFEIKKRSPKIPVILCTGYSKKISDETTESLGVDALAFKPISKSELAQTIRRLLDAVK